MKYLHLVIILVFLFAGCTEEETPIRDFTRLETLEVTDINESGAVFNAKIITLGKEEITEYGFVWDDESIPTVTSHDRVIISGSPDGMTFSATGAVNLKNGTTYNLRSYVRDQDFIVYGKQVTFTSKGGLPPVISSFSPESGNVDDTVRVSGNNFSFVREENQLLFGTVQANILSASDTLLTCLVPKNDNQFSVKISVTVADRQAVSTGNFEYSGATLSDFNPKSGTFGDIITISGNGFRPNLIENKVFIGGKEAIITSATVNEINAIIPNTVDASSNTVMVTIGAASSSFPEPFVMDQPIITGLNLTEGFTGDILEVVGDNFNPEIEGNSLLLSGNPAEIISASNTSISFRIPTGIYASREIPLTIQAAGYSIQSNETITILDTWLRKADIPGNNRVTGVGFSVDGFGYAGLGFDDEIWKYNPGDNTWQRISDFPAGPNSQALSFVVNGQAYVGGGNTSSTDLTGSSDFWRYDRSTDSWIETAPFPKNLQNGFALSDNNYGYVFTRETSDNFWRYDPQQDTWEKMPDLPVILSGGLSEADCGFRIGNILYVYALNQFLSFDLNTNIWSQLTRFPQTAFHRNSTGFAINNAGYIIIDYYMYEYDPVSDTWEEYLLHPDGQREHGFSFQINEKFYFGAGIFNNSYAKDIWEFDPLYK